MYKINNTYRKHTSWRIINMSTNNPEHNDQNTSPKSESSQNVISDQEIRQESSKAANAAASAHNKAKELRDAAAASGDPEERGKLTEQAINAEIEAESFGKTAKYLRSGAFQGMAAGAGLGLAPSATLGALTGTLVGGVTSVITSGLGGGIGAAAGAVHGPMVDMGKLAGKGVRKATSFLPSWVASEEQKKTLEKMVGQVKEEDMPDAKELEKLQEEGGNAAPDEGWMEGVKGMMPDMGGVSKAGGGEGGDGEEQSGSSEPGQEEPSNENIQENEGKGEPKMLEDDSEEKGSRHKSNEDV